MLTKYKNVRFKKGVKSPLKNAFISVAYRRNFVRKKTPNLTNFFYFIFPSIFFGRMILSILITKKLLEGSGGMLPQKIFGNLHSVMAILVLLD